MAEDKTEQQATLEAILFELRKINAFYLQIAKTALFFMILWVSTLLVR
jgi:hypothetical protein